MCLSADKLFALEDRFMKQTGLYAMWTVLFIVNLICLCLDSTTGPVRDFNIASQILSSAYGLVSSINNIHGNKLPSTMLLSAGPFHQYNTWLLLAYYGGNVYSTSAVGIYNGVLTCVIGVFTADMLVKSWVVAYNPKYYLDYVKKQNKIVKPIENVVVNTNEVVVQTN